MKGKLTPGILPVCVILLVFILCGMELRLYELQSRIAQLNTRIASLEDDVVPYRQFIDKYIIIQIDPEEADNFPPSFDIKEMEKTRERIGSYLKKKYPDKVIIEPSPDGDR